MQVNEVFIYFNWLVFILNRIDWQAERNSFDQSLRVEKQNQNNPRVLSTEFSKPITE